MSITVTKSISELSQAIEVKDVLTFSLNIEHLNQNFTIVKQCLIKMHELEGSLGQYNQKNQDFGSKLRDLENLMKSNQKEVASNKQIIQQLQNNIGDEFMRRMYGIEQKTKNIFGFDETVSKLQGLNKFIRVDQYNVKEKALKEEMNQIKKIKDQLERFVPKIIFQSFKDQSKILLEQKESKINEMDKRIDTFEQRQMKMNSKMEQLTKKVKENEEMLKEINFAEMMEKLRKFREDLDQKMNDLAMKMKKKVGANQLVALQKAMIQKLDKFLSDNEKNKAEKVQTRQALLFLEKRISDIEQIFAEKAAEDDKDALFSVKKWQCASCTKDLGKYQGKLGQYRPWAIFPCKELDPEKTGGFGYMSYLDKVNTKKQDNGNTDKLNKTHNQRDKEGSPKRLGTTARTSNLISNYGSEQKSGISLKDMYFRQLKTEKGDRGNKFFRVKKDSKPSNNQLSEKVKET